MFTTVTFYYSSASISLAVSRSGKEMSFVEDSGASSISGKKAIGLGACSTLGCCIGALELSCISVE